MANLFVTAFPIPVTSTNGGGLWDNATGTITFGTANARASGSWVQLAGSASIARAGKNFSSAVNGLTLSMYFKITSMPTTTTNLLMLNATDGVSAAFRYNQTNNRFAMIVVGGTEVDITTITPTTNQWYRLDMTATWNANPHTVDWSIDGTAGPQATFASAASTLTNFRLGNNDAKTWTAQYTDLIITNDTGDYPIGEHNTDLLYPSADGTHDNAANCIEYEDGTDVGTAYDRINTVSTPNTSPSATTYLRVATASAGKYVEVALSDLPAGAFPIGVRAFIAYTSETTTANNAGAVIMDGATERAIKGSTGSYVDWSDGSTANLYYASADIALASMDKTSVDAMTFRFISGDDASPDPYLIDMWAEVAYSLAQSNSGSVTPAGALNSGTQKQLSGSVTPTGTILKHAQKFFVGTLTSAGALLREAKKLLSGSASSAGGLVKNTSKSFVGTLSVSGVLAPAMIFIQEVGGNLLLAGESIKNTIKAIYGELSSSGVLAIIRIFLSNIAGSLSVSGGIGKEVAKSLYGSITVAGLIIRSISKLASGTLTSTGIFAKEINKIFSGVVFAAGNPAKSTLRTLSGTLTVSGAINKTIYKVLTGALTLVGGIDKAIGKIISGVLSFIGSLTSTQSGEITGYGNLEIIKAERLKTSTPAAIENIGAQYLKTISAEELETIKAPAIDR